MDMVIDILSAACLIAGSVFAIIGAVGVIRLPDVYTRMHGAGIVDTLGAGLILLGLMFQAGFSLVTVKLLLIGAFIFFTSPTTTHALARACINAGIEPLLEGEEEKKEDGPSNT